MSKKILWEDVHWFRIVTIIIFIPLAAVILYVFHPLFLHSTFTKVIGFGIVAFLIYLGVGFFIPKNTFITAEGIRIGNSKDDTYTSIRLNPTAFVPWNKIAKIILLNKLVSRVVLAEPVSFLIIKTKDGNKHWCFLARKKSFVSQLSKLKKGSLIVKGKSSDLYLEKEWKFISQDEPEVQWWFNFTFPWVILGLCVFLFWPKSINFEDSYHIIWLLVTFIPPSLLYLVLSNRIKKRKFRRE